MKRHGERFPRSVFAFVVDSSIDENPADTSARHTATEPLMRDGGLDDDE